MFLQSDDIYSNIFIAVCSLTALNKKASNGPSSGYQYFQTNNFVIFLLQMILKITVKVENPKKVMLNKINKSKSLKSKRN